MDTRHETHTDMKERSFYMRANLLLMRARTHVAIKPDIKLYESVIFFSRDSAKGKLARKFFC